MNYCINNKSLTEQIHDLIFLANKNGLPDAADWVQNNFKFPNKTVTCVTQEESSDEDMKIIDFLGNLQANLDYYSVWSIHEVWDKMSEIAAVQGNKLFYSTNLGKDVEIDLPNQHLTYMELWKYCEQAILMSQDMHHVFIESLKAKNGNIYLYCGS